MNITIRVIPHKEQRYDTSGDWLADGSIFVSDMGNEDYEFLVAVHELIEWYLCKRNSVTQESVDRFDLNFKGEGEPGENPDAPYYKEHDIATRFEYSLANIIGVDCEAYDDAVNKLTKVAETKTQMDEDKADAQNGGESEAEQGNKPQGTPPVPKGSDEEDSEY